MPIESERQLRGANVLVTGHTGFTGGWLTTWLTAIGANVSGLSLQAATTPNLWTEISETTKVDSTIGDIRDLGLVERVIADKSPDLILHLAAQPIVRRSYVDPVETYSTNVMGTLNLLEAGRHSRTVKGFVCVTTDKVYEPPQQNRALTEDDRLGGADPYSASKAAAELVASSYQRTMSQLGNSMAIATVRGGNIIGGGDWSEDRIVPDFVRAWRNQTPLVIRSPDAVRPWQHVLSACYGYLAIGASLLSDPERTVGGWNVGPADQRRVTVREMVDRLGVALPRANVQYEPSHLKETHFLALDAGKLRRELGVMSPWATDETIARTAAWYRDFYEAPGSAAVLVARDLEAFREGISYQAAGSEYA